MNKFIAGWYVVYTRPRHEKKVADELLEAKMNFYLPTKRELRTWHDRKKYVSVPLFQSYVFVYLENLKNYYDGLKVQGVLQYVRIGKDIARVSEKVINDIRLLVDEGLDIEVSSEYFQPGQILFIQHGPLTGISCEVVQINSKQRVLVRVHLLQRSLLLDLPSEYFIAISA